MRIKFESALPWPPEANCAKLRAQMDTCTHCIFPQKRGTLSLGNPAFYNQQWTGTLFFLQGDIMACMTQDPFLHIQHWEMPCLKNSQGLTFQAQPVKQDCSESTVDSLSLYSVSEFASQGHQSIKTILPVKWTLHVTSFSAPTLLLFIRCSRHPPTRSLCGISLGSS